MDATPVNGICHERFTAVREAFAANFSEGADVGASVALAVDGELVVDLWGGYTDKARTQPWGPDTIVNLYSTTKGAVALLAHMLAERGELDFDAPVARYWPEFAQGGKDALPVRYLLTHEAGLAAVDDELPPGATFDWEMMVHALERQTPLWEPGTATGYHAVTYGWLVGEVLRRISGLTPGKLLQREVCRPLGIDFLIGFGPEEDPRVAEMIRPRISSSAIGSATRVEGSLGARAFGVAPAKPGVGVNGREYRAAEVPAGNGHGNARALATIYGALASGGDWHGVHLLRPESIERARALQVEGMDLVLQRFVRRSLGFMLPVTTESDPRSATSFGHPGMGGSVGFADPERRLGFGYAMNQMGDPSAQGRPDPRWVRMFQAALAAL